LRTAALIVVDLTCGAFDVAVVVESLQTAEHLLTAATHEISNLMRAQKAMAIHHAYRARSFPLKQSCLRAESADAGGTSSIHFTMENGRRSCCRVDCERVGIRARCRRHRASTRVTNPVAVEVGERTVRERHVEGFRSSVASERAQWKAGAGKY
jgi:hypothetical protein